MGTAIPAAVAHAHNFGQASATPQEGHGKPEASNQQMFNSAGGSTNSEPDAFVTAVPRQPLSISIAKRPAEAVDLQHRLNTAAAKPVNEALRQSPARSAVAHVPPCTSSVPQATDNGSDSPAAHPDMSDTPFMRVFRAHGGMCTVRSLTVPAEHQLAANPGDLSDEDRIKANWQSTCERVLSVTTSKQRRAYIEEEAMKHPPPPELPQTEAHCYSPVAARQPAVQFSSNQHPAVKAYALRQAQMSQASQSSGQNQTISQASYAAAAQARQSQIAAARAWTSAIAQSVADRDAVSSRVASVYERLQGASQGDSPQKRTRGTLPPSPSGSSPVSDAVGLWESKSCALCGLDAAAVGSTCCECAPYLPLLLVVGA